jgi:predicted Zn-dependent protease
MALNPVEGEPGTYECLLGPMTFAHLVEQLGVWSSAFYVDAEMSFLTGLLGQEAASREFTLYDDPTLAGTYGAAPFDAEGVPTRRNTVFENGVLKTYLHNTATAQEIQHIHHSQRRHHSPPPLQPRRQNRQQNTRQTHRRHRQGDMGNKRLVPPLPKTTEQESSPQYPATDSSSSETEA